MNKNVLRFIYSLVIILVYFNSKTYAENEVIEIVSLTENYTYDAMVEDINLLKEKYGDLISTEILGQSYDSRDIYMIKLGFGETGIVCSAGVHARETINTQLTLKMIEDYAEAYNSDKKIDEYNIKKILSESAIYFVPLLNPDGYVLATEGISKINDDILKNNIENIIKKSKVSTINWKSNARGVDINRNFGVNLWGKVIGKPSDTLNKEYSYAYFGGLSPNTELETKALLKVFHKLNIYGYIDFHSRGNTLYWYKHSESNVFNGVQKEIADGLSQITKYRLIRESEDNKIDGSEGTTTDYVAEIYDKPSFTIETLDSRVNFPINGSLIEPTYKRIKNTPLFLAQKAVELKSINYYKYKVYQNDRFLHDFNDLEKAKIYAEKYSNTFIFENEKLIWESLIKI